MKKQAATLWVCLSLVFAMAACGGHGDPPTPSGDSSKPPASSESMSDSASSGHASEAVGMPSSSLGGGSSGLSSTASTSVSSKPRTKIRLAANKTLVPLYAGEETVLHRNPDRGFRLQLDLDVQKISTNKTFEDMKREAAEAVDSQIRGHKEPVTLAQMYLWMYGFGDRDITPKGLQAVEACLEMLADKKMKALLRFAYQRENFPPYDAMTDASQERMLRHIDQLAPVVEKAKYNIHALEAGFVGAWGEWHSEYYPKDHTVIMRKIADVLLPDETYLQVRQPKYKNLLPSDHPVYKRTGIHNDAIFGKTEASKYGTNGLDPGKPQWTQLVKEAAHTPQGGEFYWSAWNFEHNYWPAWESVIHQFSEHRFTSLSILHGYWDMRDGGREDETVMGRWKKEPITLTWLNANKIIANPNFFRDKNGKTVRRTVFDYIHTHLGYCIEGQNFSVQGSGSPGSAAKVTMELVNYGFSAAFNLESGFAILDEKGRTVSETPAGDPARWFGRNPDNYEDARLLRHTITANIKLPQTPGRYKLAFYLKNKQGNFARISNRIETAGGYHILHEFDI